MKKMKPNMSKRNDMIFYSVFIILPILQFSIFYIYVNINSVILAFQEYKIDSKLNRGSYVFCGFDNFEKLFFDLFNDGILGGAFWNTLITFAVTMFFGIGFAMVFSFYISKKMPFSKIFRFALFLPSMISSIVTVLIFRYFSETVLLSLINSIFDKELTGLLYGTTDVAFGMVLFFNIWIGYGTMILMFSGAMSEIGTSIIEAAMLDGAKATDEFFKIYIPLTYPTMVTFIVVSIAGMFSNQINLFSFFGSQAESGLWTIGYWLFKNLSKGDLSYPEYPQLAAAGVILTIIVTPLTLGIKCFLQKVGPSVE